MHANKPKKKRVLTEGERLSEAETKRRQWNDRAKGVEHGKGNQSWCIQ